MSIGRRQTSLKREDVNSKSIDLASIGEWFVEGIT